MKIFKFVYQVQFDVEKCDSTRSKIIVAETEKSAIDNFQTSNEEFEIISCVEMERPDILSKNMYIDMPNGYMYTIPIDFIAREHAEFFADDYDDFNDSLYNGTVELFRRNENEIFDFAKIIEWSEIEEVSTKTKIEVDLQNFWEQSTHKCYFDL